MDREAAGGASGGAETSGGAAGRRQWLWLLIPVIYVGLVLLRRSVLLANMNNDTASAIWPTSAILATGLLLMPRRQRRWSVAIVASSALVTSIFLANGLRAALGVSEGVLMAALARLLCGPKPNFSEGRKLFVLLVGAVIPTNLLSAVALYGVTLAIGPPISLDLAVRWFVGHALGAAIFIPAVAIILDQRRFESLRRGTSELAASLAVLCVVASVLFFGPDPALWFLVFPMLMLLAFRYGPLGAAAGAVIISLLALVRIYGSSGPQQPGSTGWMQLFVAVAFLTTLPAAGAVASYARTRSLLARRSLTARHARRRADAAAAAKGEFLANMSHEIRTPLNGVIGLADALSRTELTPQQRDMLGMILSSGKALTGLLSDALDLARADSGALSLAREPFDVRSSIAEAAFLFESLAREKGLAFEVGFDVDPPGAVLGDALRIRQIVSNLIANAVKFTSRGSVSVQVSLKRRAGGAARLTVTVRDTGPGFDEEVKARLFSRFEQGDSSVTRRYGGTGLGLAIAQRLAGLMDGTIECDASPGKGAVFSFGAALELAAGPVAADRGAGPAGPVIETGPVSVLLAEDNLVNQKVVQAMLDGLAELTVVADGEAAIEAVRTQAFDVILMDTHMPRMDGLTAIRAIRAAEAAGGFGRTPIISLTADAMAAQVSAAIAAGADLHVAKPITAASLIGALRAALEARPPARIDAA